jgi:hypothetical protein
MAERWSNMCGYFRRAWQLNLPIIVIVLGFLLVMPWGPFCRAMLPWLLTWGLPTPFADYERALREAAIKTSADQRILRTITTDKVQLVHIRNYPLAQGDQTLTDDVWAALPDELRQACAGAGDPLLRVQQILGLPPRVSGQHSIYQITAQTKDVKRPCMSGDDLNSPACRFDLPSDPTEGIDVDKPSSDKQELKNVVDGYRQLRFVAGQMWNVYRTGFQAAHVAAGDYPYKGFPFTGMGWSYDWSRRSRTHVGVSEFVIKKGALVTVEPPIDPATFCNGTSR